MAHICPKVQCLRGNSPILRLLKIQPQLFVTKLDELAWHGAQVIRIIASLFMIAGLMIFAVGVNSALQSSMSDKHLAWRAKTESVAPHERDKTLLGRFIASFRDVVNAEKKPPKSDLQRLLDRRRRDTAPFDLGY